MGLMPHSAMYFTNIARDSSCTKEFPIKKKNPNPRQRINEMKARCSNFNNRELCGRKNQRFTETFVKIKTSIMNNTDLGGKMLNFHCKDTDMEPYNCGTKKLRVSFQGGSNNLY